MINKKICMLGSFAVGKTALVRQFVSSIFSDKYLSTVGVKISKKPLIIDNEEVNLMLWDLEGQDNYSMVNLSYLRGANGLMFVTDGTRGETLSISLRLRSEALKLLGHNIPSIFIVNKADLIPEWEITDKIIISLESKGVTVLKTSAKTGLNVENCFNLLTEAMLKNQT